MTRAILLAALLTTAVGAGQDFRSAGLGEILLVTGGLLAAVALFRRGDPPVQPAAAAGPSRWAGLLPEVLSWTVLAVSAGTAALRWSGILTSPRWSAVLALAVLLVLLAGSSRAGRLGQASFAVLVAGCAGGYGYLLHTVREPIDVEEFLRVGSSALVHGHNPWALTFHNIYANNPTYTHDFYAPQVVSGDRLLFGFPYPPIGLLAAIPGWLLGDVRFSHLIALVVVAVLLRLVARDAIGRRLAALPLLLPTTPLVLLMSWTEPVLVALLAFLVASLVRYRRLVPYAVGALFVAKQYMAVAAPLLWMLPVVRDRRMLVRAGLTAVVLTVPFVLWNPAAFWHSVVALQFLQPFRKDATSVLVWSVQTFGWPPPSVYGVLPLAAGGLTAVLLAVRAPRTPGGFAGALGLTLLVTILLSKQAFANYYFFVAGAFAVAAVAWPVPAGSAGSARSAGSA